MKPCKKCFCTCEDGNGCSKYDEYRNGCLDVIDEYHEELLKNFVNMLYTNTIGEILDKTYYQMKLKHTELN